MENATSCVSCSYCGKTYAFKGGLSHHLAKQHALEEQEDKETLSVKTVILCMCVFINRE